MDTKEIVISVPGSNRIFCRDHYQIYVVDRTTLLEGLKAMFSPMPQTYAFACTTITGYCRYDALGNFQVEVATIYHAWNDTPASWAQQLENFAEYAEGMEVVSIDIEPHGLPRTTILFLLGRIPSHD